MTFILTNDDGIDAPGIQALRVALNDQSLASRVSGSGIIVAPLEPHSGCGHQVTTTRPIQVSQRSPDEFAISGTPVDCTRIALNHLFGDVDFVLSGINAGGNLGSDIYISGTVAAVREAALHRIPGIAISQYIHRGQPIDWERAAQLAVRVLDKLLSMPIEPGCFWNVNLPHISSNSATPDIVMCPLCTQPLPAQFQVEGSVLTYAGNYSQRARDPGADVDICFSGHIAVTQIQVGS